MRRVSLVSLSMMVLFVAVGCGDGGDESDSDTGVVDSGGMDSGVDMTRGESLYRTTEPSNNSFTCSTCHALQEPAADGLRRPGHPIGNATKRPSYKNGKVDSMREAVNSCLTEWMNAEPWTASSDDWKTLRDWLDSQATTDSAEAVSFEIVAEPGDISGGDPDKGRELFNNSCKVCHGKDGVGTNKAIALANRDFTLEYIARRVRTSGDPDSAVYDGLTFGKMPFWSKERLSTPELRHIGAFLTQDSGGPDAGMDVGGADTGISDDATADTGGGGMDAVEGDCESTHPMVGQTAELQEKFHNVGGTAEIIDNCTVEIRDFTYDGKGITVEIYGTDSHPNYTSGYSMSDNLVRSSPYRKETLVVTLPDGKTLDDLNGISVWCVDVGADFGSGKFE